MTGSNVLESPPPTTTVHSRPSPEDERPSQRLRRDDGSQITQRSTADDHPVRYLPFLPPLSSQSIPYPIPGRNEGEVDLPRISKDRKAAELEVMSRIDAILDSCRGDSDLTAKRLRELQLNKRMESCGNVRGDSHDDSGAQPAPDPSGHPGEPVPVGSNGSDNARHPTQGVTGSTPQMVTQQSADRSWDGGISASSSHSLAYPQQHYSSLQANHYHFDQSAPPESTSFNQNGSAYIAPTIAGPSTVNHTSATSYPQAGSSYYHPNSGFGTNLDPPNASNMARSLSTSDVQYGSSVMPPPIAGPSTVNHPSITSYPQAGSSYYHPNSGFGPYLNPPNTSNMARSLSTSDVPSMAAVPGGFWGPTASTSGTWDNSNSGEVMHGFAASRPPPVYAPLGNPGTAPEVTTSYAQESYQIPPSAGTPFSLPQSSTNPVPALYLRPSLSTSTFMQPLSNPIGHDFQTANATEFCAGCHYGGPVVYGSADQGRTTLKEDTEWLERTISLSVLAERMRSTCNVPEDAGRAEVFQRLRFLFGEMFGLCYISKPYPRTKRQTVSQPMSPKGVITEPTDHQGCKTHQRRLRLR
jgi:hypothetical protein